MDALSEYLNRLNTPVDSNQHNDLWSREDDPRLEERNIFSDEFMIDQVSETIDELKNGKACGRDRIPNEFLKVGKETLSKSLQHISSNVTSMERVPRWCRESRIHMLFKGGDKGLLDNYRGDQYNLQCRKTVYPTTW